VEVITRRVGNEVQIERIEGEADHAGEARMSSGPWRIQDGWWSSSPADREYWDVELLRGGVYRVYREAAAGNWYLDARYD
jgi:hypothetical protein